MVSVSPLFQRFLSAFAAAFLLGAPGLASAVVGNAPPAEDIPAVMIVGSRGNSCTGTLVAADLVLTAAHCVMHGSEYKIVDFDGKRQPMLRDVTQVRQHPRFNIQSFLAHRATADVALLKLAFPLRAAPAQIAIGAPQTAAGDPILIAGYGVTQRGDGRSGGTLRAAALVATGKPGNLQLRLFDQSTRNDRPGLGACTGDSGGPALIEKAGKLLVIGVISWSTGPNNSDGCGGLSGITPLTLYRAWIAETAAKLGSPLAP
jgi:secreted trypsin-like serine protease